MFKKDRRFLTLFIAFLVTFGIVQLFLIFADGLGWFPDFRTAEGMVFTLVLWIGVSFLLPIFFLQGLLWYSRSNGNSDDYFRWKDIPKDAKRPHVVNRNSL